MTVLLFKAKREYCRLFQLYHPDFAECIGKGAGRALQFFDSQIMVLSMRLATEIGLPLLSVHDEFIFPEP